MLEDSMTSHENALYHTLLVPVMYVRPELTQKMRNRGLINKGGLTLDHD